MGVKAIKKGPTSGSAYEDNTQWLGLANLDTGAPLGEASTANNSDRTIQVNGTFGAGGSGQLEGSNDGVNWNILTDPLGNSLVFTSAGMKAVTELPRFYRPEVTAGDGTTALNFYLFSKGGHL